MKYCICCILVLTLSWEIHSFETICQNAFWFERSMAGRRDATLCAARIEIGNLAHPTNQEKPVTLKLKNFWTRFDRGEGARSFPISKIYVANFPLFMRCFTKNDAKTCKCQCELRNPQHFPPGAGSTGSRVVWAQASLGLSVCLFLLLSGYFVQCSAFLRTLLWNCGESRRGCAITIQSWRFNWDFRSGSVQQWQLLVHKTHLQIWYVSTVNVEIVQNWTKHFHILKREFRQKQDPGGSEYFFSLIN